MFHTYSNQEEACLALMDAGADICYSSRSGTSTTNLMIAMELESYQFLKAIATHPRVTLDTLVHECV